MNEILEYMQ